MHSPKFWSLTLLSAVATASDKSIGPAVASHFQKVLSPGAGVFLPSDSNYTTETIQRWDSFSAPNYVVSVKPALDTDVQQIVSPGLKPNHKIPDLGHNERCNERALT